ncbi:hypothetical protein MCOR25_003021 [Pyricularia grisea]|uniref:NADH:ubiquinone oxidoreductase 20.1kD subunit n=1 Tax=Pyricularia grisea TaxID=148305 RepID=A0A6P8B5T7_PYRGI|nr:hypothetical protein PgNI_05339 [Pyricularia grisea]KAI6375127.1 hypothetical protein MCOR25_003021 [Pyricularia grisea]TLD10615.1 hypothetical protein PgNI_05339 [Pyricularia grisea]
MLSRQIVRAVPRTATRLPLISRRTYLPPSINSRDVLDQKYPDPPRLTEEEDPGMNGGYVNPLPVKRQFRDPHGDWWDKQERRNFGEPVHEDFDLHGMFTPHEYTWTTPGKGAVMFGTFVVAFLGVLVGVKMAYPDIQSYPREFEGGLERELGGPGAMRARMAGDPEPFVKE